MDPISAFSLFCNVVQTIEAAVKTGQTLVELCNSSTGFPKDTQTLLSATGSLKDSIGVLQNAQIQLQPPASGMSAPTPSGMQVASVATECAASVDRIEALLEKCKAKKKGSILAAGSALFRARKYKSELAELQKDMEASRESLKMAVAVATRTELMLIKSQFQTFGQHQTNISKSLVEISGQLKSSANLGTLVDDIKTSLAISEEALQEINHDAILQALCPASAGIRFNEINDPDAHTFQWMFQDPQKLLKLEPKLEYSLSDWLRNGTGVFHIAGKPGSGKSTLLKFIAQHTETRSLLEQWAQQEGKQLIFSKFFFWKIGSVDQRTLKGMTRGLVYDVTRQYPGITKVLFPNHWNPHGFLSTFSRSREIKFEERDITAAFDTLVNSSEVFERFRICIFLDGLDEFDERDKSHWELATTLLKWTTDPNDRSRDAVNIKLCVSSRELPSIISSFPERQRITLHNLTLSDIEGLVQTRLGENNHFKALASTDPAKANALLEVIATQSSGVFLWVVLLLKLLVEELASGESSIGALDRIVESSLGELDDFFDMILNSIPRHHRKQAYVVFAIMMRCVGLHLIRNDEDAELTYIVTSKFNVSLVGLSYLFEGFDGATQAVPDPWALSDAHAKPCQSSEDYESRVRKTAVELKSWCRGLVDVASCDMKVHDLPDEYIDWATAIFTHRSVAEFLINKLRNESRELFLTDDIISQHLLRMGIWEVRLLFRPIDCITSWVNKRVLWVLHIVRSRPVESKDILQLLNDLDKALLEYHKRPGSAPTIVFWDAISLYRGSPSYISIEECSPYFTTLAASIGHHEYLAWKIGGNPVSKKDREWLSGALFGGLISVCGRVGQRSQSWNSRHVRMLKVALDTGILSAHLLDHGFPVDVPDSAPYLKIFDWLYSFDHQIPGPEEQPTCITDFTIETVGSQKRIISPWRYFLTVFFQFAILAKRGQVVGQLWQCLEYLLDAGVPTPTTIYAGFPSTAMADDQSPSSDSSDSEVEDTSRMYVGFQLRSDCHQHQREESQVTPVQIKTKTFVGSGAFLKVYEENCKYLIQQFGLFGRDAVESTTFESFVRYHRPPNMDRLLELIGRQTPLRGGDGSDPDSIWDLQRIIEEAPNSLGYPRRWY